MDRMKIPYGTEMQIVRRRMQTSLQETAREFGMSRAGVMNIMKRNKDIVDEAKSRMREDAIRGIIADATPNMQGASK